MTRETASMVAHLIAVVSGAALYAILLAISSRAPQWDCRIPDAARKGLIARRFPFWTAVLGLVWNIGSLAVFAGHQIGLNGYTSYITAAAFTALGLLPAVVIHSVLASNAGTISGRRTGRWITLGYLLSMIGGGLHFGGVYLHAAAPSLNGLYLLTIGFLVLLAWVLFPMLKQPKGRINLWVVALSIASVGVFPMSFHNSVSLSWGAELISHYAALPLVLAILYKDYRFAFADLFLKRALALIFVVVIVMTLAVLVVAPLFPDETVDPWAALLVMTLWAATALLFPSLQRAVAYLVDSLILRRPDYQKVKQALAGRIDALVSPDQILEEVCIELKRMSGSSQIRWVTVDSTSNVERVALAAQPVVFRWEKEALPGLQELYTPSSRPSVIVRIQTAEAPCYFVLIQELPGERRLLSDDFHVLESVALMVSLRLEALRNTHARCTQALREQEILKLANEAELRAFRSQMNPHFLFNALNTIGYLIEAAPDRALQTLLRLSELLRTVMGRLGGEFSTLGEEIDLVEAYIEIEKARFEDRLRVRIQAPRALRHLRMPALLLQPLVENAVKHGVQPSVHGADVLIEATLSASEEIIGEKPQPGFMLHLTVTDTGVGASGDRFYNGREAGVGLANLEGRLRLHYGEASRLRVRSEPGKGTVAEATIPVREEELHADVLSERAGIGEKRA